MGARAVSVPAERVAAVRGFNRFYTNAIGALREGLLDSHSAKETGALLGRHDPDEQRRLVDAMRTIRGILGDEVALAPLTLRAPRPGDYGWVVGRHGAIYAAEYGWDETFEALVARIVADFVDERDASREAAWIADLGGSPAGCVFCVKREATVAQLRLLLVEPSARGKGIGAALVNEGVAVARRAGDERMVLV